MAANRKGPVLKWENNVAWPGKLTLTDKALYFEVISSFFSKSLGKERASEHSFLFAFIDEEHFSFTYLLH
jgi:hypothetical protein